MFKLKSSLRESEPGQSGGAAQQAPNTPTTPPAGTGAGAPAPDVQALIDAALAKQAGEFSAQLEQATGHKEIKGLTEAQLKAQGKLQELADSKAAEAQGYKAKYEGLAIKNALLTAAKEAVDPETVVDLLSGKATVSENDVVTIGGQSPADAVKALLDAKPFLAKALGGTGSGAPANGGQAVNNPWSKEHYNLTEQIRLNKENPSLAAQMKAAAGK